MLKNNKGLTLVTMIITVLVMLILLSTLTYTAYTSLRIRGLNKLYNDIRTLNDKVAVYYMENGQLPVGDEYATITVGDNLDDNINFVTKDGTFTDQDSLVNPNDYNDESGVGQATYYNLDLELFDNISLENDGQYIINEQSHTIYYVEGVTLQGTTYYTLLLNYKDTEYNLKHPIDIVTVRDVYLPMGGLSLDLQDYMTFQTEDGSMAVPRKIDYTVTTSGYENYFTLDNGIITSNSNVEATTLSFEINATISSYESSEEKNATLTVYLTDIDVIDPLTNTEITHLNFMEGESETIYAQKYGNAGNLRLIAKVETGNGIDARVSNNINSSFGAYPITIEATNAGKIYLTVIENNGRAAKGIEIDVFDPSLNLEDVTFDSLDETEDLILTIDERYEENPDRFEINWSSSNTNVVSIENDPENKLEATLTSNEFGTATIYCEILVDGEILTTLESNVMVTGVSIEDIQMEAGERILPSYIIDSNISNTMISDIEITSSDTTILEILKNEITNDFELSALKAGTSTVTITVKLVDGTEYKDTCVVSVSS